MKKTHIDELNELHEKLRAALDLGAENVQTLNVMEAVYKIAAKAKKEDVVKPKHE